MIQPQVRVEIDFSNGPSFGYPLILGDFSYGILDTNVLGDAPADIVDITSQVRKVSTRRGRNRILSQFEAGTATVTLNDPNGDFNPQNPSSPYFSKLLPLRKIRIFGITEYAGDTVEIPLFAGYVTTFDTNFYVGTNEDSLVTLQCVDGFRLLANVSTEDAPVPGATAGQLSGTRIETLLDFAGFPDSMQAIQPGNSTVQADPGGNRSVLQAVQTVEQSEFGGFYMTPTGKARFIQRSYVSQLADVVPVKYTDSTTPAADEYPYSNLDIAFDDQLILNDVTVTRLGGTPQTVISQPSIDVFFYKSSARSDLLMQTDAEALSQAQMIVASRSNATIRIDSMSLNLNGVVDELNTLQNLSLDIYTLINIEKEVPGGSTISSELFVQGVQHDITPNSWNIKVYTAEPIIQAFILDSTTQGVLNQNVLTY
jgi:hypothetical protein